MKSIFVKYLGCLLGLAIIAIALFYMIPLYKVRAQGSGTDYAQLLAQAALFRDGRLQWVGAQAPSEDESAALWAAFGVGQVHRLEEALPPLERYLVNNPSSAWAPSLHSLMGKWYREHGYFTFALRHFAAAWAATQSAGAGGAKRVADFAVAHELALLVAMGHFQDARSLLAEAGEDRILDGGPLQTMFLESKDALGMAARYPEQASGCGSVAVDAVARILYPGQDYGAATLSSTCSPTNGFSLSDLVQLCAQTHIDLVAVERPAGDTTLVVPSVVHIGLNHYVAIVEQAGASYKVSNPSLGSPRWLTSDAINVEASGYFLVPRSQAPISWKILTGMQADAVRGGCSIQNTGCDYYSLDPGPPCPDSSSPCPSCNAHVDIHRPGPKPPPPPTAHAQPIPGEAAPVAFMGMPTWYVSEAFFNLWLQDEPMSYQPARGPRIRFNLRYKMLNSDDGATWGSSAAATYFNFGQNWLFNWRSYIDVNDASSWNAGSGFVVVTVHWPNGSRSQQLNVYKTSATIEFITGASLQATADGSGNLTGITAKWPDGSQDTYNTQIVNAFNSVEELFMNTRSDPTGAITTLNYTNLASGVVQLNNITDVDGNLTTFTYVTNAISSGNPTFISQVSGPYGSFSLQYDSSGNLQKITDAASIQSSMSYAASGQVQTLVTPYGTNTFTYSDWRGKTSTGATVSLQVTDPMNRNWLYVYTYSLTGCSTQFPGAYSSSLVPTEPINTLDNSSNQYNLSFFWNPGQYEQLSTTDPSALQCGDFLRGRMRHWLVWSATGGAVNALSLEQAPSPDGSTAGQLTWYDYPGKTSGSYWQTGTNILLGVIADVLPDASTRYTYYQRNAVGNVTSKTTTYTQSNGSAGTRSWTYGYWPNNIDVQTVTGPNSASLLGQSYNSAHEVLLSTNAVGDVTTNSYDSYYRLTNTSQASGLVTTYTYGNGNATNYVSQITDQPINRTSQFTWANTDVSTIVDARGLTNNFSYDALHRLTNIAYPIDSTSETFTYTALDITSHKDRLGYVTSYTYNGDRQLTSVTDANTNTTHYGYCDCGSLTYITNALTQTTQFAYDQAGRMTNVINGDNTSRAYGYDALGQLTSVTDANGTTALAYNNQGLLVTKTNLNGQLLKVVYDIEDRATSVTDANGVIVTQTFDNLGELTSRTYPDSGVEYFKYQFSHLVDYTNQISKVWQYAYDAAGRQTNEITPNSETVTNSYNAAGDLLTLTDGKNHTTSWGYDTYGRVTSKTNQAGVQILTYGYDADSRLTNRWSKAFGNTSYTFDCLTNVLKITYPHSHNITYAYDAVYDLTNMADALGTTTFTYTSAGNLSTEVPPWASDTVTYSYHTNVAHLRIGLTVQQPTSNWSQTYAYDSADRLYTLTSPAGTFTNTYLNAGMLVANLGLPNTSKITNQFDNVARMTNTALVNSSGTTLNSHGYVCNQAGQRTEQVRTDGSNVGYTYDNDGQVATAVGSGGQSTENLGYLFDAAWNLNHRTNGVSTLLFNVDAQNQLTTANGSTCTYDNNGNLTAAHSYLSYSYDDENELTQVADNVNHSFQTQFVYDGLGRRRRKLEFTWNSTFNTWVQSGETRYIYDGRNVVQERDGSNNPQVAYTRGNDLSGSLQGAGGIGGMLARSSGYSAGSWGTHDVYHADANGNITYLADSTQNLAANYRYDPFGNVIAQSGTLATANVYQFSSKEFHLNSITLYYGFRYYDYYMQRFLNRDPIAEAGGVNLYEFVRNAPLSIIDPVGWSDRNRPRGGVALRPLPPDALMITGDGIVKGLSDFFESLGDFWYAYKDMREANTINADKYFHCMANCKAVKKGPFVPLLVSVGREVCDTITHLNHPIDSIKDSIEDLKADQWGWSASSDEDCRRHCNKYRPPWLSTRY